ncbi:Ubiquinone biosynthesis O-methyltransferase [Andreprevotia sp. IGB-42]|uniref:methyltransferase domain-containing protein n=1 Tax=Andreprevotia sp. IGB-42 TaxID=2497473 RepID=UPI00135AC82F|nr:methyltransferase domain-containing protein [Andreprevotia sp. IGB-42]KAF0811425.1 Ubiquinone biosynthesis O-methyltransferase [Andreprevotia sp. IGB-42]
METHVYEREVAGTAGDSLSHVTQLIQAPGAVLDVGTGSGALGRYLLAHGWPMVDGITYNQAELERAQSHYRDIWLLDLTAPCALAALGERRYRYIVCADVLEHVTRPESVLAALTTLLADDGEIIISIPNVGYVGVIAELLGGDFLYRNEGLLDSTHLRFFTRRSLQRLLQSAGLAARGWHSVVRPLPWSEFDPGYADRLPPAVQRYLCARVDAHAYQFVVLAGTAGVAPEAAEVLPQVEAPHFLAQVYWAAAADADTLAPVFTEADSVSTFGLTGVGRQTLHFPLPQLSAPLRALRIDPADRPGVLRLYGVRLMDRAGRVLWQWQPSQGEILDVHGMLAMSASPDDAQLLFAVFSEDPALILPLPPLAACMHEETVLALEMGWPQVPEASVLGQQLAQSRHDGLRLEHAVATLQTERADADTQHALEYARFEAALAALRQQLAEQQQSNCALQQSRDALQLQLDRAEGMLAGVRHSKLWRLGRLLGLTRISL